MTTRARSSSWPASRPSASARRVGYEFAHSIIDDHTGAAFAELHHDERAQTITGFVERALGFFRELEIEPRRVQTDNNGKVERYQQTLKRERGLGQR